MKKWLKYYLIIMLIIFSLIFLKCSSDMNELLEGKLYTTKFNFVAENNKGGRIKPLVLQDFTFYYDFTKNQGNISFVIPRNLSLDAVDIYFPSLVDNDTFNIFYNRKGVQYNLNKSVWLLENKIGVYEYSTLYYRKGEEFFNDDEIIISFSSDIKPKGRYYFEISGDNLLRRGGKRDQNIHFVLGNNYQCSSPCTYSLFNINERYDSFDREIKLEWQIDESNPNNLFYINAFSRRILFIKDVILAVGTALLISLFVGLIPFPKKENQKFEKFLNGELKVKGIGRTLLENIKRTLK